MEKSLKDLLSRLPIPGLKDSNDRHTIAEIVTTELGISIKPKQISLREGVLSISVPPVVKSALQIKQQIIKEKLNKENISLQSIR